jgi:hypothetical protein
MTQIEVVEFIKKHKLLKPEAYLPDSMFIPSQLQRGIEVELEHTPHRWLAKMIAKAHLVENPRYYTYLDKMEKQMDAEKKRK